MHRPLGFKDWDTLYKEQDVEKMPWYLSALDHDFERTLKKRRIRSGAILDLGTGPGTQAMALAERGFKVVAVDISATAVKNAAKAAKRKGLKIDFRQDNILETKLKEDFDLIFDRGCFHVLSGPDRRLYIRNVTGLLKKGGFLFLKTFSVKEPGKYGPHRFASHQIRTLFVSPLHVHSIKESFFKGSFKPDPHALFCVIQKD